MVYLVPFWLFLTKQPPNNFSFNNLSEVHSKLALKQEAFRIYFLKLRFHRLSCLVLPIIIIARHHAVNVCYDYQPTGKLVDCLIMATLNTMQNIMQQHMFFHHIVPPPHSYSWLPTIKCRPFCSVSYIASLALKHRFICMESSSCHAQFTYGCWHWPTQLLSISYATVMICCRSLYTAHIFLQS